MLPHPTDPQSVTAALSSGGVYQTTDGGASWEARNHGIRADFLPEGQQYPEFGQCVHKITRHPSRPERLYLQNHGGVYRSDDEGRSGSRSPTGCPPTSASRSWCTRTSRTPIFVFPINGGDKRYPPEAKARVWRSRDAGETWEELGDGLPDAFYVAVMRDAMCADDHDRTGLYFGARNGAVWGSADEGEHLAPDRRRPPRRDGRPGRRARGSADGRQQALDRVDGDGGVTTGHPAGHQHLAAAGGPLEKDPALEPQPRKRNSPSTDVLETGTRRTTCPSRTRRTVPSRLIDVAPVRGDRDGLDRARHVGVPGSERLVGPTRSGCLRVPTNTRSCSAATRAVGRRTARVSRPFSWTTRAPVDPARSTRPSSASVTSAKRFWNQVSTTTRPWRSTTRMEKVSPVGGGGDDRRPSSERASVTYSSVLLRPEIRRTSPPGATRRQELPAATDSSRCARCRAGSTPPCGAWQPHRPPSASRSRLPTRLVARGTGAARPAAAAG